MPLFIDRSKLSGTKYGSLTLQSEYRKKSRGLKVIRQDILWKFICDCGNIVWSRFDSVKRGHTKSCGCTKGHHNKIEYGLAAKRRLLRRYKMDSKKRSLLFELNFEDFIHLTSSRCSYCNKQPSNVIPADGGNGNYLYNGIDRIDNSIGYFKDNCQTCCTLCNNAKKNMTHDEFLELVSMIYRNCIDTAKEVNAEWVQ